MQKIMSDHEIFEDIEECRGTEAAEAFGNCTSDIPEYPVERIINRFNQELIKLEMPYLIKDLADLADYKEADNYVWTVVTNTNPQKLDMCEIIRNDERGRAVYKLLVELFDELSLFFPSNVEGAVDLFKIDLEDNWCLYFFKTWLVSINMALLPQRTAQVIEAIERNTYQG